jgi:hypothetical protein
VNPAYDNPREVSPKPLSPLVKGDFDEAPTEGRFSLFLLGALTRTVQSATGKHPPGRCDRLKGFQTRIPVSNRPSYSRPSSAASASHPSDGDR